MIIERSAGSLPRAHRDARLELLARQTRRAGIAGLVGLVAMVAVGWNHTDRSILLGWAAAEAAVLCGRLWLSIDTLKRRRAATDRLLGLFTFSGTLAGLVLGSYALLFFPAMDQVSRYLATTALVLWATVAVTTMSQFLRHYLYFVVALLAPLMVAWMINGGENWWLFGLAIVCLAALFSSASKDLSDTIGDSIAMRYENAQLLGELAEQIKVADAASRAKSNFIATASHDLRQPAAALSLYVDAMTPWRGHPQLSTAIAGVARASRSISALLESLLDLSRLDAGIVQTDFGWFPIEAVFSDMASEFEPKANAKGLKLTVDSVGGELYSDRVLLSRVLRNLLENAVRYTAKGSVRLAFERAQAGAIRLKVIDTGIGIDPSMRERVFDEYFQINNPGRERDGGLGVGLSIVRRVSALLGIGINLADTPGGGTTVTVELPKEHLRAAAAGAAGPADTETPVSQRGTIVLRENDIEVSAALIFLLESWNFTVVEAPSVEQALSFAADARDLRAVVSDYRLPETTNGIELLNQVRRRRPDALLILITGDTGTQVLQEAVRSEVVLLHKPVTATRLRELLLAPQRGSSAVTMPASQSDR